MGDIPSTRKVYRKVNNQLQLFEEPIPKVEPSDVLIRVHAVSLNWKDGAMLKGIFPWPELEMDNSIPCCDFSGEVIYTGERVRLFTRGDRVIAPIDLDNITGRQTTVRGLGQNVDGTLASYLVLEESVLVRIPDYLSWAEACILPCAGLTAWSALNMGSRLAGKTVLIEGTGGVSLVSLLLAIKLGARTIVTSSSDEKLERVKSLGATYTINYKTNPTWEEKVQSLTNGIGVDIVVEQGGPSTFLQAVKCLRSGGRLSQVGFVTSESKGDFKTLVLELIIKRIQIVGIQVGTKGELEEFMDCLRGIQLPLRSAIDQVFAFENSSAAFKRLTGGHAIGKVVIQL